MDKPTLEEIQTASAKRGKEITERLGGHVVPMSYLLGFQSLYIDMLKEEIRLTKAGLK